MEKGLAYLIVAFLGVWLMLDDFFGGQRVTKMVQKLNLPDLPDISEILGKMTPKMPWDDDEPKKGGGGTTKKDDDADTPDKPKWDGGSDADDDGDGMPNWLDKEDNRKGGKPV